MSIELNSNAKTAKVLFVDQLDAEIERRRRELDALLHARSVLREAKDHRAPATKTAPSPTGEGTLTVSETVEQLIRDAPRQQMHLDDILIGLEERGVQITRKNLANTLNRWLSRGKKFERVRANTFGLR